MKTIMKEYGGLAVSVAAAALLLVFLFGSSGKGFLHTMAGKGETVSETYSNTWTNNQFKRVTMQKPADIRQNPSRTDIRTDTRYNLKDLFEVKNSGNMGVRLEAEDVRCKDTGKSILLSDTGRKLQSTTSFVFQKSGIYEVDILATDSYGVITQRTIDIPVERK